jgi:hypothetical protein
MSDMPDPFPIHVVLPVDGHAVSSSSTITVSTTLVVRPAPPDQGFHAEARISAPVAPAPILTTPFEFHHSPLDLVITVAAAGAIVAWHIRRVRLDAYVRATPSG